VLYDDIYLLFLDYPFHKHSLFNTLA